MSIRSRVLHAYTRIKGPNTYFCVGLHRREVT